jgi:hypothetical protein
MSPLLLILTTLAALGCAVLAGVFIAFSTLVMKALGRVPAPQGILAMQEINRAALTPAFMVLFLGTTLLCGLLTVWSFLLWGSGSALLLLAGGVHLSGGRLRLDGRLSRPAEQRTGRPRPVPGRLGLAVDQLPAGVDPVEPCARVCITGGGRTVHGGTCPAVNAETAGRS